MLALAGAANKRAIAKTIGFMTAPSPLWCGSPRLAYHHEVTVRVECYAGHRGEETPRALIIDDRRIEVVDVIDRWLAPNHRYFKLMGDDGDLYIVRHDPAADTWELTMFKARGIS
jgi:hypothetical protein